MEVTVHPMVTIVLLTSETVIFLGVTGLLGPAKWREREKERESGGGGRDRERGEREGGRERDREREERDEYLIELTSHN